jgi:hypothetical protein
MNVIFVKFHNMIHGMYLTIEIFSLYFFLV